MVQRVKKQTKIVKKGGALPNRILPTIPSSWVDTLEDTNDLADFRREEEEIIEPERQTEVMYENMMQQLRNPQFQTMRLDGRDLQPRDELMFYEQNPELMEHLRDNDPQSAQRLDSRIEQLESLVNPMAVLMRQEHERRLARQRRRRRPHSPDQEQRNVRQRPPNPPRMDPSNNNIRRRRLY